MKGSMLDAEDDLFTTGGNRSYTPSFNKTRPTMISAKYRLKEERRKVLKISINKLKKIEDPESSLRRSVLINNTMKRLQREAREERREKQQINSFPRYTPSYKSFVLREDSVKLEEQEKASESAVARLKPEANKENASPFPSERKSPKTPLDCLCDETIDELVDVTTLDEELSRPLEEMANPVNLMESTGEDSVRGRKRPFEEDIVQPLEALTSLLDNAKSTRGGEGKDVDDARPSGKRRCYEEVEDSEIHDVLSQFYIPPTPRMLTSIDDEEEVNVVDIDIDTIESEEAKHPIVTKVPDFEELVSEDMDDPVPLSKHTEYDDILSCKRPPSSTLTSSDASVFCKFQSTKDASSFETATSYSFLSVESKRHEIDNNLVVRPEIMRVAGPGSEALCEIGSDNCGTVGARRLSATGGDALPSCRAEVTSRDARPADRRSPIARISEVMGWTSKCVDGPEFKYSSGASLGKTLSDCCYSNPETNNNNTEQKYSCAHAAIFTELQSQVYHNFVTSLES